MIGVFGEVWDPISKGGSNFLLKVILRVEDESGYKRGLTKTRPVSDSKMVTDSAFWMP